MADNTLAFSTQTFVDYARSHKNTTYYMVMSFNLLNDKSDEKCKKAPMIKHGGHA
jgi:hypothetical protein